MLDRKQIGLQEVSLDEFLILKQFHRPAAERSFLERQLRKGTGFSRILQPLVAYSYEELLDNFFLCKDVLHARVKIPRGYRRRGNTLKLYRRATGRQDQEAQEHTRKLLIQHANEMGFINLDFKPPEYYDFARLPEVVQPSGGDYFLSFNKHQGKLILVNAEIPASCVQHFTWYKTPPKRYDRMFAHWVPRNYLERRSIS